MKKLFFIILFLSLAVNCFAVTELDYMEYATDGAAQAAYVTNAIAYSSQYPTHDADHVKTTSLYAANYEGYRATNPANSLTGTWELTSWISQNTQNTNQRFHIDLGSAKVIKRIYLENGHITGSSTNTGAKNFTFWGSNSATAFAELTYGTDTNWTQLTCDISTWDEHVAADQADPQYALVTNSTAYQYYAMKIADCWGSTAISIRRIELQTEVASGDLQSYSEATIKTQGSYSLKGVATTGALNKTLTRTVSPTINLTGLTQIKYDIYSSRTGSNIKIGIHDSGGTTTEHTANIASAGGWETQTWDISGVTNANKDAIDSITFTQVNADSATTWYIDNAYVEAAARRIILIQ